jgi:hypothetical protein
VVIVVAPKSSNASLWVPRSNSEESRRFTRMGEGRVGLPTSVRPKPDSSVMGDRTSIPFPISTPGDDQEVWESAVVTTDPDG